MSFARAPAGSPSIRLAEIARTVAPTSQHARRSRAGIERRRLVLHRSYGVPYGIHVAVVRVDRDTGEVEIERYLVAYDVGRAVNPMLIEGQIVGGWRRASAARCMRSSSTTSAASRCR